MASLNINYSSLPFSDHTQLGSSDLELEQMPASRATSHVSTSASNGEASDDQQDPLVKNSSFSRTKALLQAPSQKPVVQRSDGSKTGKLAGWRRKLQGWRFGLAVSASAATFVLVTNVLLVVGAASASKLEIGIGTLYLGNCTVVNKWNTALHVLINALSSIMLSASNYAMQCLSSPKRSECDDAHARRDWLNIGVSGVRNLTRISRPRRVLWILLAISSIPIHLLFNSAVFKTLDANEYDYDIVREDFLAGAHIEPYELYPNSGAVFINGTRSGTDSTRMEERRKELRDRLESAQQRYLESTSSYDHLSPQECVSTYGGAFVSGHSNVFLVTGNNSVNLNVFSSRRITHQMPEGNMGPFSPNSNIWVCDESDRPSIDYCDSAAVRKAAASNWIIRGQKIDYCISQRNEPRCKLEFSIHILVVVIICNLIKSIAMFWTLLRQRENTLVTFGDALASWLESSDTNTSNRCLMSKKDILHSSQKGSFAEKVNTPMPVPFSHGRKHRCYEAISPKRWAFSMIPPIITIIAASLLLHVALTADYIAPNPLVSLGFGALSPAAVIRVQLPQEGIAGLTSCVLLANLPQLILSFLYLMYNGLYTSMHMAHEYAGYATERKALRVTTPRGTQRSTYWLQLPYSYGVPLILASAVLHWLVSQSIFLARVTVWFKDAQIEKSTASAVGYSPAPILCTILLGTCMLIIAVGMSFRKLPSSIPIAGSCSMALAAAAHRTKSDVDAAVLPVKWGVVHQKEDAGDIGHCSFTSEEVTEPQDGKLYAGDTRGATTNGLRYRAGR